MGQRHEHRETARLDSEARRRDREEAEKAKRALERSRKRRRLTTLAVAALVVFALAMGIQTRRISVEAERANQEARAAQQVSDFLVQLFEDADRGQTRGQEMTARDILERGAEKIESELREEPEIQARLMNTMGKVYASLGCSTKRRSCFRAPWRCAQETLGDDHVDIAESLYELAQLSYKKGEYEEGTKLARRALELRRQTLGQEHVDVAESPEPVGRDVAPAGSL